MKDVLDLNPATDAGVANEHLPREMLEAHLKRADQLIARSEISALHPFEQFDQHGRLGSGIGHLCDFVYTSLRRYRMKKRRSY